MRVVRILLLSTAFAAGILATLAFFALDSFVYRGFWLPVALIGVLTWLIGQTMGDRLGRSYKWIALAISCGVVGFWSLGLPVEILMRFRWLGLFVGWVLPFLALASLMAFYLSRKRSTAWLGACVAFAWLVVYFSGNTGRPGPMIDWFAHLGLTVAQAEAATLAFRKSVHFCGYGTIALSAFLAAVRTGVGKASSIKFALGFGVALASFDEIRQSGSFFRTGSPWDVLLDIAGMVAFLFVAQKLISYTAKP
jgi:hypothetical protein